MNSIRRRAGLVAAFLEEEQPDVIALQETRCSTGQFPTAVFAERGYEVTHFGDGPRNGVALASKLPIEDITHGFGGQPLPPFDEPRSIFATVEGIRIGTVYAPNGRRRRTYEWHAKLAWFELLGIHVQLELDEWDDLVVIGDYNVCPTPDDVYDPIKKRNRNLVSDEERAAIAALADLGLTDVARSLKGAAADYTWYAQQRNQFEAGRGYRLDLALASDAVAERAIACDGLNRWRQPELGPSDHVPLLLTLG